MERKLVYIKEEGTALKPAGEAGITQEVDGDRDTQVTPILDWLCRCSSEQE